MVSFLMNIVESDPKEAISRTKFVQLRNRHDLSYTLCKHSACVSSLRCGDVEKSTLSIVFFKYWINYA